MQNLGDFTSMFLILVKIALWILLFLYLLFAGIVVKQARVMTETLQVGMEKLIKGFVVIHFIASVFVFLLSLIVL